MAKVPPQFQKKSPPVDTRGKGNVQPGNKSPSPPKTIDPRNRKVPDAPNAQQDDALAAARNALVGPKTPAPKGKPKGNPYS